MVSRLVRITILFLLTMLVACATRQPVALPELAVPAGDPLLSSPSKQLWAQGVDARAHGNLAGAGRLFERAITLEPESSWLYREMAELRLRQNEPAAAEGLARKALRLAPDDMLYRSALWQLVAMARLRQGDEQGAQQARLEAEMLLKRVR